MSIRLPDDDARERSINHLAEVETSSVVEEELRCGKLSHRRPSSPSINVSLAGYRTQGSFRGCWKYMYGDQQRR